MGEELELKDIIQIIWKRKILVFAGTLLCVAVVAVMTAFLPKIYKISTLVEPGYLIVTDKEGQLIEKKPTESPEMIKESILGGAYDQPIRSKLNIRSDHYPEIEVRIPSGTMLLSISLETEQPNLGVKILREMNTMITKQLDEQIENEKEKVKNDMQITVIRGQATQKKIELLEKQIKLASEKIADLEKHRQNALASGPDGAMSVFLYLNEIQDKQIYLNDLQEKLENYLEEAETNKVEIEDLKIKLGAIKNAQVYKEPIVPEKAVKPNKSLLIGLSLFLSFPSFILLALFLEYFQRTKGPSPTPESK